MPSRTGERGRGDFARAVGAVELQAAAEGLEWGRGLTTAEVARRYRVGEDRVRTWIKTGVLQARNTADVGCGKPRFIVFPAHLDEFERTRQATAPLPKPQRRLISPRWWWSGGPSPTRPSRGRRSTRSTCGASTAGP